MIELQPDNASAHHNLGTIYLRQQRSSEAIASFRQSLRLRPDAAHTLLYLGDALAQAGQQEEAEAAWRKAAELAPDESLASEAQRRSSGSG